MHQFFNKTINVFLFAFFCFLVSGLHAQQDYLGTKTPYHPQQNSYTKPPGGYVPVFINYTGRHGSRFLTSAGSDVLVLDVLQQAKLQHALTKNGEKLFALLAAFDTIEKKNYGNITLLGREEQHNIAARMQQNFPQVLQGKKIMVEMTEKPRTQQSAQAFLSGLKNYTPSAIEAVVFNASADSILRFYDLSPAYDAYVKSDAVVKHTDSLQQDVITKNLACNICKKIFEKGFIDEINSGKIVVAGSKKSPIVTTTGFAEALYDVYAILFSARQELGSSDNNINHAFKNIFTKDDLRWLDKINSAEDFFEKGPAENSNGIQAIVAAPLLRNLIVTTDSAVSLKNTDGIFRFTHAEAISPLATLMQIPQASAESNSAYMFYKTWKAAEIIPLSANIQWILYSNGSDYLVKVLLNEKEVALPVATSAFPYYSWNDVKDYYIKKLSAAN